MPDQDIELYATFAEIGEHNVEIDSDIKNGTVTADKAKAKTGDTIKLTVTPDKGYVIYKVTMNGDQVAINDKGEYALKSQFQAFNEDQILGVVQFKSNFIGWVFSALASPFGLLPTFKL